MFNLHSVFVRLMNTCPDVGMRKRESQHRTISCPALASRINQEGNRILVGEVLCEVDHEWCLRFIGGGRGVVSQKQWTCSCGRGSTEPTIVPKRGRISLKELAGPECALSNRQVILNSFILSPSSNVELKSEGGSPWDREEKPTHTPSVSPVKVSHRYLLGEEEENSHHEVKVDVLLNTMSWTL